MPMGYLVSVESPVLVVFPPPHDDVFAFEEGRPTGVALAALSVYNVVHRTLLLRTLAVAHALNLQKNPTTQIFETVPTTTRPLS